MIERDLVAEAVPMMALRSLHWSEAGTYMCCPELIPQILGVAFPPGTVTYGDNYIYFKNAGGHLTLFKGFLSSTITNEPFWIRITARL